MNSIEKCCFFTKILHTTSDLIYLFANEQNEIYKAKISRFQCGRRQHLWKEFTIFWFGFWSFLPLTLENCMVIHSVPEHTLKLNHNINTLGWLFWVRKFDCCICIFRWRIHKVQCRLIAASYSWMKATLRQKWIEFRRKNNESCGRKNITHYPSTASWTDKKTKKNPLHCDSFNEIVGTHLTLSSFVAGKQINNKTATFPMDGQNKTLFLIDFAENPADTTEE